MNLKRSYGYFFNQIVIIYCVLIAQAIASHAVLASTVSKPVPEYISLVISDPFQDNTLEVQNVWPIKKLSDSAFGMTMGAQWEWSRWRQLWFPVPSSITGTTLTLGTFLRKVFTSYTFGTHAHIRFFEGREPKSVASAITGGFECIKPHWHYGINMHIALTEQQKTVRGINGKISRAIGKHSTLTGGIYYRAIKVLQTDLIGFGYFPGILHSQYVKPKFGFRISYHYLYNTRSSVNISYTYDNWMRSQINFSWIIVGRDSTTNLYPLSDKLKASLFRPIEAHFGPSLENRLIPQAAITAPQHLEVRQKFHQQRDTLISDTVEHMLNHNLSSINNQDTALIKRQRKFAEDAKAWVALSFTERYRLFAFTQAAPQMRLPLELKARVGTHLLPDSIPLGNRQPHEMQLDYFNLAPDPTFQDNKEVVSAKLLDYIEMLSAQEPKNKTLLKVFCKLPSAKTPTLLLREYVID